MKKLIFLIEQIFNGIRFRIKMRKNKKEDPYIYK